MTNFKKHPTFSVFYYVDIGDVHLSKYEMLFRKVMQLSIIIIDVIFEKCPLDLSKQLKEYSNGGDLEIFLFNSYFNSNTMMILPRILLVTWKDSAIATWIIKSVPPAKAVPI